MVAIGDHDGAVVEAVGIVRIGEPRAVGQRPPGGGVDAHRTILVDQQQPLMVGVGDQGGSVRLPLGTVREGEAAGIAPYHLAGAAHLQDLAAPAQLVAGIRDQRVAVGQPLHAAGKLQHAGPIAAFLRERCQLTHPGHQTVGPWVPDWC